MDLATETRSIAAFLQGRLMMDCSLGLDGALAIDHVEQGTASNGDYLPYFDVVTQTGLKVRVAVTPTL